MRFRDERRIRATVFWSGLQRFVKKAKLVIVEDTICKPFNLISMLQMFICQRFLEGFKKIILVGLPYEIRTEFVNLNLPFVPHFN